MIIIVITVLGTCVIGSVNILHHDTITATTTITATIIIIVVIIIIAIAIAADNASIVLPPTACPESRCTFGLEKSSMRNLTSAMDSTCLASRRGQGASERRHSGAFQRILHEQESMESCDNSSCVVQVRVDGENGQKNARERRRRKTQRGLWRS